MIQILTPETTKPLISLEIRGSGYIEFGGEGVRYFSVFRSPATLKDLYKTSIKTDG
jgi:hypothetical protein